MRSKLLIPIFSYALLLASHPAQAQLDIKTVVVKHLTTSRDFTLKVAEQMPETDYGFKLTPAQISKTYSSGEGSMTGLELLMFVLDHTTHHRASAEMYLRAKGITPAEYQF